MAVPSDIKSIIDELTGNPKYTGECPSCSESFKLKDAGLFYLDNLTSEAKAAKTTMESGITELATNYKEKLKQIKKGAPQKSLEVNVGKVVEKVAPALAGFPYSMNDCRFLAEPIDYMVFSGVTARGKVDEIVLMDIKTGKARLNTSQRLIKDAVDHGRVELRFY